MHEVTELRFDVNCYIHNKLLFVLVMLVRLQCTVSVTVSATNGNCASIVTSLTISEK